MSTSVKSTAKFRVRRPAILLKLAFENIRLNWRHSLATLLAIVGGFAAIALFDGFVLALQDYSEDAYVNKGAMGHVLIEKTGSKEHSFEDQWTYMLSKEQQAELDSMLAVDKRVDSISREMMFSGLVSGAGSSAVFIGIGEDVEGNRKIRGPKWEWNTIAGRPLAKAGGDAVVIGIGLAKLLGCAPDESPLLTGDGAYVAKERPMNCKKSSFQFSVSTEHAQANATNLKPAGVIDLQLREVNDRFVAMPLAVAQRLLDTDRVSHFSVTLRDPAHAVKFARDFQAAARARGLDVEATFWLDHPDAALSKGGMELLSVFRILFLTIVAVIAAMSVANSMMKSINERIREIGTLRSFGFRRSDILLMFSLEGLLLGLFASAIGIVCSVFLTTGLSHLGLTFKAGLLSSAMPLEFSIALPVWIGTALVLSLITFGASWLVSRRAARMPIADALRYVA